MKKQLPLSQKLLYAAGSAGYTLIDRALFAFLYYYYTVRPLPNGKTLMAPLIFSAVLFFGRIVDAVADPLIARWSDNYSSKWGRRIPFMAISGVFYAAVFIVLFYPVVPKESPWNIVYLVVMLGLYFLLFTAYVCPYLALLPELSRNTRDRVDLSTYKAIFSLIGGGIALLGAGLLIEVLGFHGMVWAMGLIGLVFLYLPVFIREKEYSSAEPATLGLIEAVVTTFRNKAFVIYLVGINAFWFAFNMITINMTLYVTELLGQPEESISLYFAALGTAAPFFPLINWLAKKHGLKKSMLSSMLVFGLTLPWIYFLKSPPGGISPDALWFILLGICGFAVSGLLVIPDAIVAAVSDLEKKISGQQREAMYFGAQGLILKLNLGLSTLLSGALLQFYGNPLGIQLTGPLAGGLTLLGALLFSYFPEHEIVKPPEAKALSH
jgi:GPH family glycoside/pentoside/hexuronide:cation symporter